jgi:uncharacterized protein (DUF2344 family)
MKIYILKNINQYEDGEIFFHVDLFKDDKAAQERMKKEFNEFFKEDFGEAEVKEIDERCAELRNGSHVCTWEITYQILDI